MSTAAVVIVAMLMTGMGGAALTAPVRFLRFVGSEIVNRDGRNEVRAVYGGFGIAMAGLLLFAIQESPYRAGILVTLALAFAGMAAGRIVSIALDRGISPVMAMVLVCELAMSGALVLAL